MELSMRRPFHHRDFAAADLVDRKGAVTISVCVPAKNEAATIGGIVEAIRTPLVLEHPLVDEIVVVDDRSTDGTGALAAAAGATVVSTCAPLADVVPGTGKGEALWRGLAASTGDLVVFCDADITDFDTRFVLGLVGPLLVDPTVQFVKGFYERPDTHAPGTGGRTTELVARPLVSLLFPSLTGVVQPLSGEYAARRRVLEQVPFVQGYGVDLGLLIDVQARWGAGAIAQVDLVSRHHRNRSLDELSPQALSIMQTAFARAGLPTGAGATLRRPGLPPLACTHVERPPLVELRQAAGGQASA
jgi:glucosyl-3-phosphoglycerate synthase